MKNCNDYKEDDYRRAAALVREALMSTYIYPDANNANPSLCLKENIFRQMALIRRKQRFYQTIRNIAAVFIVLLIIAGTVFAVNVSARNRLIQWLKTITDQQIIFVFDGENSTAQLTSYRIHELPDGFILSDQSEEEETSSFYYRSANQTDTIYFQCSLVESGDAFDVLDTAGEAEILKVNGMTAEYYTASEGSIDNVLIWIDEEQSILFVLSSTLAKDIILRMAESIYE